MSMYEKTALAMQAQELSFVRDTLEKMLRLADVLRVINTDPGLRDSLGS